MSKPGLITSSPLGSDIKDPLTDLLRSGARELIANALEAELLAFLDRYTDMRIEDGRHAVVRNGYLPKRTIHTGIGDLEVQVPKTRDRSDSGICFSSKLLPAYYKPSVGDEGGGGWSYLMGGYDGDFRGALTALLGNQARMLGSEAMLLLKRRWQQAHDLWCRRELRDKRYVCWWANCVYSGGRMDDRLCLLVITGITEQGVNELVAVQRGYRESTVSWEALLDGLHERGLNEIPQLAIGDGELGFWKAIDKMHPSCRHQICWGHKAVEVFGKLPEPMVPVIKKALYQIWMASSREEAHAIFDRTLMRLNSKCTQCSLCAETVGLLAKDREELLAFYDFPQELWGEFRRPTLLSPQLLKPSSESCQSLIAVSRPRTWLWPVSGQR